MSRPSEKALHMALKQTTQSLIAKDPAESSVRRLIDEKQLNFPGAPELTIGNCSPHSAVIGSTGAGKTNILKLLMMSVLPCQNEHGGLRFRSVVFDPKRELYPFLFGIGIPESQLVVTHPFDERSAAWDLAADFKEPAQIEELAQMIVPEHGKRGHPNQFFDNAARIIVQDLVEGLIANRGQDWDLRDIVCGLSKLEYLKALLLTTENGTATWEMFLSPLSSGQDARTAMNILSTIRSYVRPFQSLAALWYKAEKKYSVNQWASGSGLLLMGSDPQRRRTMERMNRLLIRRISQVLLSRNEENPIDQTWWFVDELREAGKLNGLRQLLNEGRSKGVRMVLGFQDIEGLYSLYEKHEAEEMIGLCANRIFLHLDGPSTRRWASDFLGEAEEQIPQQSESLGRERTVTTVYRTELRKNALPIEFHNLPLASPRTGIGGWFAYPGRRNEFHLPPDLIARVLSTDALHNGQVAFIARSPEDQVMPKWTDEDLFGLTVEKVEPQKPYHAMERKAKRSVKVPKWFEGFGEESDDKGAFDAT